MRVVKYTWCPLVPVSVDLYRTVFIKSFAFIDSLRRLKQRLSAAILNQSFLYCILMCSIQTIVATVFLKFIHKDSTQLRRTRTLTKAAAFPFSFSCLYNSFVSISFCVNMKSYALFTWRKTGRQPAWPRYLGPVGAPSPFIFNVAFTCEPRYPCSLPSYIFTMYKHLTPELSWCYV